MSLALLLFHPLILLLLAGIGLRHVLARPPAVTVPGPLPATLIMPLSGDSPLVRQGLESILAQDPAPSRIVFAVRDETDPAHALVRDVASRDHRVRIALGRTVPAKSRKNANLLAGVAQADPESRAYLFCDAGHPAPVGLAGQLLAPILAGRAVVSSGYHRPTSEHGLANLLHEASVIFLHCLQGLPLVAQPWGGAMAVDRMAFEKMEVDKLWLDNVVDDCSLAALLQDRGLRALMVSGANATSPLARENFGQWWAWWVRQLQYLKYCFPGTWILAGAGLAFLGLPPLAAAGGLAAGHGWAFGAYALTLMLAALAFRRGSLRPASPVRWLPAFFLFLILSPAAYAAACLARAIVWRGVAYTVGRGGRVLAAKPLSAQNRATATTRRV